MGKKFGLEFEGMDQMIKRITDLGGNVKTVTEKALKESHSYSTKLLHEAIAPHKRSGRTEQSLVDSSNVKWVGDTASVEVGFDISNGGLASVFLMHGTPKIKKDQKLYNAVYGKQTQQEIARIQQNIFYEELRKL